jgi:hypothetical protein
MDGDDRRVPERARLGVPTGLKRRIEMQPVAGDLDACNERPRRVCGWSEGIGKAAVSLRGPTPPTYLYAVQIVLKSMYLSIACGERSRPNPDCLKPPNGVAIDERS